MPLHNPPPQPIHPTTSQTVTARFSTALCAIRSVHSASDPCDLLACLCQATRACGVREGAYVHVIPDPEQAPRLMVMLACSAEHIYEHLQSAALNHPWLRYAHDHIEPTRVSMLTEFYHSDDLEQHLNTEVESILIVPTHSGGTVGRYGALLLDTHERDGELPSIRLLAHSLARELHDWWVRRTCAELQAAAHLRFDDLKLLAFERQGLSTKQIARLLDTGTAAVDSRFQRITTKMGTANRRHAALRAAIHGLL